MPGHSPTPIRPGLDSGPTEQPPERRRILIVDDDLAQRVLASVLLQSAGYSPAAVGTVARALERIDREDPELVLTDLVMPGLGNLLRAVRARPTPPVVIAMTASDDDELVRLALELGAVAVLRKPLTAGELAETVRAGLERTDQLNARKIA